jgi:Mg-chelatase subunit ChlD
VSRRDLAGAAHFDEVSPDVGELDEAAVSELLEDAPDELLAMLAEMSGATDVGLRALAKQLAARLFLDLAREQRVDAPGIGRLVPTPYRPDRGDLDLDLSLDGVLSARGEQRLVRPEELVLQAWSRPSTAWCLLIDRSGSMHGASLATAAMAAAAVAVRAEGEYAALSFARDVVATKAMWETRPDDEVIDRVLALRGHGTTDVAGALRAAREQFRWAASPRRVTVLLSDCRSTEPGDAVAAARQLDELVILAPEGDSAEAEELAGEVGARWTTVAGPASIVAALAAVLDRS